MDFYEYMTLGAVALSPTIAILVGRYLEDRRKHSDRRFEILKTLIATRSSRLDPEHVRALNLIDIEFSGNSKMEQEIRDKWQLYRQHLRTTRSPSNTSTWDQRTSDLLHDLLYSISQRLGYKLSRSGIESGSYYPDLYLNIEVTKLENLDLLNKKLRDPRTSFILAKELSDDEVKEYSEFLNSKETPQSD